MIHNYIFKKDYEAANKVLLNAIMRNGYIPQFIFPIANLSLYNRDDKGINQL